MRGTYLGAALLLCLSQLPLPSAHARPSSKVREVRREAPTTWSEIVEPHAQEVRELLEKARGALRITEEAQQADGDWSVTEYMRYFTDAYHLMRHARTLAPDNLEVIAVFARAAEELGHTREARAALERAFELAGDRLGPELLAQLGAIQLRAGEPRTAIRTLRLAQGPARSERAAALFHLANALAATGDVNGAIDVLQSALPPALAYYTPDITLLVFTLGVIYDRDEQQHAAFDVLERLRAAQAMSFTGQVQSALQLVRFAPSEDQHYYQGLLYELNRQYVEARASFAAYAASGDSPWRARALEHIRAIDAERRRAPPAKLPAKTKTPAPALP